MVDPLDLALTNLGSPIILSFALGLFAALAKSDLSFPEAIAKGLSIYLLFAIGFKGGVAVAAHGMDAQLLAALLVGIAISFLLPLVAFPLLQKLTRLPAVDIAAVAGHYGSISIVTFLAASSLLTANGMEGEAQFAEVIHPDHFSPLHVMPIGTANLPRAMRAVDRLPIVLDSLNTAYDLVVIDGGPGSADSVGRLIGDDTRVIVSCIWPTDEVGELADRLVQAGLDEPMIVRPSRIGDARPGRSAA